MSNTPTRRTPMKEEFYSAAGKPPADLQNDSTRSRLSSTPGVTFADSALTPTQSNLLLDAKINSAVQYAVQESQTILMNKLEDIMHVMRTQQYKTDMMFDQFSKKTDPEDDSSSYGQSSKMKTPVLNSRKQQQQTKTPTFTQAKKGVPSPDDYEDDFENPDPTYDQLSEFEYPMKIPTLVNPMRGNSNSNQNVRNSNQNSKFSNNNNFTNLNSNNSNSTVQQNINKSVNNKRSSILDNLVRSEMEATNSQQGVNSTNTPSYFTVQYTRQLPSYDHIILKDLKLKSVVKFTNDILDYEFRFKVPLDMKALISPLCFERLSIKYHKKLDYQDQYKNMDRKTLVELLLDYVKPENQSQFRQILEDIKLKYYSSTIKDEEYNYFHEALIGYSLKFMRWYNTLADGIDVSKIPPCNNKEKGLIRIFLSKLPGDLGQEIYTELVNQHTEMSDKNLTFHVFYDKFISLIESHYEERKKAVSTLTMYSNVGRKSSKDFKATQYASKNTNNSYTNKDNYKNSTPNHPAKPSFNRGNRTLNNIEEEFEQDSSLEDVNKQGDPSYQDEFMDTEIPDNESVNENSDNSAHNTTSNTYFNEMTKSSDISNNFNTEVETVEDLHALDSKGEKPLRACFSMIMHNKCENPRCQYTHSGEDMYKAHAQLLALLNKSKFANKSTQSQKYNGKPNAKLNAILPFQSDCCAEMDFEHQSYLHFMKKSVLDSNPYVDIVKTVVRSGIIQFSDGSIDTIIDNVLFDTGALHGNYLSLEWFNANRKRLNPSDIEFVDARVRLADNKTVVHIEHVVRLTIAFCDDKGNDYQLNDYFSVINTSNTAIIGLPAIITQLGLFFQEFIGAAILKYSTRIPKILKRGSSLSNVEVALETKTELQQPWSMSSFLDEAPEDLETPLPCAFSEALHFMEVTYEQAKQDFIDLIPTHVSPEFLECTDIRKLLVTKGLNVFIPQNWKGVQGVPPLKLEWKPDVPTYMKPKPWPVNPRLYGNAYKECQRLQKYFYRKSNSPVASNLVIAPKATPPFIRFCGNYVAIGKYIITGHYPIPRVIQALEKIVKFAIFLDFDLANAFHQFIIDDTSSGLLSVQTPWGQFEPMFLPEGIPPASGELQKYMDIIFESIKEFAIVIFDNLLVLATDYNDAYNKVNIVFDICLKHNLFLKFSKTWLGFPEVKFFGYMCRHKSYSLAQERKDSLQAIPFPTNKKAMQSFLGAALFFKNFIPNYSSITAPLNDMLKKEFVWDPSQWKLDYIAVFNSVKLALQSASSIFYPNYELKWILRTDASDFGVGAVLLQVDDSFTPPQHQPIGFVSQKLSAQATRWSTIEKEAYAVYYGVKSFAYYLVGMPFILQTDHANLQWMEASVVPKILRWRIYLQAFQFVIQHIPGKANTVADWLSRLSLMYVDDDVIIQTLSDPALSYSSCVPRVPASSSELSYNTECYIHMLSTILTSPAADTPPESDTRALIPSPYKDPKELLHQVHNSRMGHHGIRRTYLLLNSHFPGHRIPYRVVAEFVTTCPICQKERLGMVDNVQPLTKHLKTEHIHSAIGADVLTVTPEDEFGNSYLIVIVNHFTKLVFLYAAKTHDAVTMATALFNYISIYGLVDVLYSDPGSDLMSETVQHLNKWLGIRHKVSLVDRHESNGVEGTNKQILKHLRAIVYAERVLRCWSSPTVLPIIQYIINSTTNSETNMVPFELHFGQQALTYHKIPTDLHLHAKVNDFVQNLNSNLKYLLEVSRSYQRSLVSKRTANSNVLYTNQYQAGDYVLKQLDMSKPRPSKLHPQFLGPYEVIKQLGNDIEVRNIISGAILTFHVDMVKIFHGDKDAAFKMAMLDTDQYEVDCILAYRGNPIIRTTTEFLVKYKDGEEVWIPYNKDISSTEQFETFCRSNSQLMWLLYSADVAKTMVSDIKKRDIDLVQPGDTVYIDIRCYGETWYMTLDLPDKYLKSYVVEYHYFEWVSTRNRRRIRARCDLLNETWTLDNIFVHTYGHRKVFDNTNMVLLDNIMINKYNLRDNSSKKSV